MAIAWCPERQCLYCQQCAEERVEEAEGFGRWPYTILYRCPWCHLPHPALDRLEHDGAHPIADPTPHVDPAPYLQRSPAAAAWRVPDDKTDDDARASWNRNAALWDAGYDDDGDRNRRYQSDEPMLAMLGEVRGRMILDAGSGNGYLCRKLARLGATVTGVELSDAFLDIARAKDTDGITYVHASVTSMPLEDASHDKAVSNYVLMDVPDYEAAIREVHRVLEPGGTWVVVISHPAFACGPEEWYAPAPDTPRPEDYHGRLVDDYFKRGPYECQWGDFHPVLSFHRPLRDYWRAFTAAGFTIDDFEEPSITDRGRAELPPSKVLTSLRIPWSCIFRLRK